MIKKFEQNMIKMRMIFKYKKFINNQRNKDKKITFKQF